MINHNDTNTFIVDALQSSKWDRSLLEEWRTGKIDCVHVTCDAFWVDARTTLDSVALWYGLARENSDLIELVEAPGQIEQIIGSGKIAVVLGFQSSAPIENDLDLIEVFVHLGVRVMQLTYNNQSLVGGSCYEDSDAGLTRFGHEVINEMNRLGMLIDLSHVGEVTSLEAIEASNRPVAITHSNPRSFVNHPRNKSDRVLTAMAEKGGVLGITMYPPLIGGGGTSLESWTAMVMRTIELIGIDAVGIGSDASRNWTDADLRWVRLGRWARDMATTSHVSVNTSWPVWPEWFETPADFPRILDALSATGLGEKDVDAVMGGNWLRLFNESFSPHT